MKTIIIIIVIIFIPPNDYNLQTKKEMEMQQQKEINYFQEYDKIIFWK